MSDIAGTAADRLGELQRLARVLQAMPAGILSLDATWRVVYLNQAAVELLGVDREWLLGRTIWEAFPGTVGTIFEASYRSARSSGQPVAFEAYYPVPLDAWYEVRVWPSGDELTLYFVDVSERRAVREQLDAAQERAALLAQVTADLAATLDTEAAVARFADLVVPRLADWCIVSIAEVDTDNPLRGLRDLASTHADPGRRATVARYAALRATALTSTSALARSLSSGQHVILDHESLSAAISAMHPGEAKDLLTGLDPVAVGLFPLHGRGRVLGVLSLFNDADGGDFRADAVELALEVTNRAGLALDNARIFAQQRLLSEVLQRSLLTAPPAPDHMQIAVRYEPAAEAAQVGGDWYDSFLQPDGATVLVIGDVVGHDTAAAAAMGQLRSLLRGIAASGGEGPAQVLCKVDEVIETLQVDTTATALVARVEQTPEERERDVTHLRWSNAGHPPAMVINPDGSVLVLSGAEPDLLLGIDPRSARHESEVTLDRGATVLLYTDGLVERRGQGLDEGLGLLQDTLVEVAELELEDLCDELLRRLLPVHPEDDVALVAVRLHRQDRPRPPEAGPVDIPANVAEEPASTTQA